MVMLLLGQKGISGTWRVAATRSIGGHFQWLNGPIALCLTGLLLLWISTLTELERIAEWLL